MKKFLLYFSVFLFNIIVAYSFINRDEILEEFLKKVETYSAINTSEKVHLHLDKPFYSIGDDLWFKAYVVNTKGNELSTLSNVLYIDLIDDQDSLRKKITMPLVNGLCFGSIKLTDSLIDEGRYHIRAYTKWMLNFDQEFVYKKDILIGDANSPSPIVAGVKFGNADQQNIVLSFVNLSDSTPVASAQTNYTLLNNNREITSGKLVTDSQGKLNIPLPKNIKHDAKTVLIAAVMKKDARIETKNIPIVFNSDQIDVQFFPESGKLVGGIRSKVAIKALASNGKGINVSGYIIDQNNNRIIDFKTEHAGMGIVALKPNPNDQYTAIITGTNQPNKIFPLPKVELAGFVLSLDHVSEGNISVKIATTAQLANSQTVYLVALQNGTIKFISKVSLNKSVISSIVPKSKFSTGITQFTLFSSDFKPLAERLIFINQKEDEIKLELKAKKQLFGIRDKVEMEIIATDLKSLPAIGSFSVSVTNENKIQGDEDQEMSILSDFLLTSDLKGYIEDPNYYFHDVNDLKIKQLDFLMLTQGWRRFKWNDIITENFPILKYKSQKGLELSGIIVNQQRKPIPNGKVELFANTQDGLLITTANSNEKGIFNIDSLRFTGNAVVTAKGTNSKKKGTVNVYFDKPIHLESQNYRQEKIDFLNAGVFNYLRNTKTSIDELVKRNAYDRGIVLKDVVIKASYIEKNMVKGSRKLGNSVPDIVIQKEQLRNYSNMVQAFYGLPGIEVLGNPTDGVIAFVGRTSLTGGKTIMKVILDGSEIDPDMLKDIPVASVEGIEILKRGSAAIYNAQGVIVITSKSGADVYNSKYVLNSFKTQGYEVIRDFYSPKYEQTNQKEVPDLRSTIFWKPDLITDENGKTNFSFYSADEPGKYKITIEGLDIKGKLSRKISFLEIVK